MQLATFMLDQERFAVPSLQVEEFFRVLPTTRVYGADKRIDGLVNIRGKTAVVLNMRSCFEMPPSPNPSSSEMILLETTSGLVEEARRMGLFAYEEPVVLKVDSVTNIHTQGEDELHPPPAHIKQPFVEGVLQTTKGYYTMISIEKLIQELLVPQKKVSQNDF